MAVGTTWAQRFRVVRRLGSGGAGSVWEAEDERLGRTVAIKQLHLPSGPMSRRFEREARLGASLRHPGLVAVFDIVREDQVVLMVMEHVAGGSLADRFREDPPGRDELLRLLSDVAAALDHAHAHGIIHRDIKPANILIGRDGRAKLADLGIAMAVESTRLTAHGELLGTVAYLAPELVRGAPATPASDVYALAAVAFEGLAGRRAHTGRNAMEILRHVREEPSPDLRGAWPAAPPRAAAVIAAGMAASPGDRPPTATRFVEDLEAALSSPAPGEPRRHDVAVTRAGDDTPRHVPAERQAAGRFSREVPRRAAPAAAPARRTPAPAGAPSRPGRRGALVAVLALLLVAGAVTAILAGGGGGDGGGTAASSGGTQEDTASSGGGGGEEAAGAGTGEAEGAVDGASGTGTAGDEATAEATPAPSGTATGTGTAATATPPGRSPRAAVRGFYELAAADDFVGAWALAGPQMQAAFGNSLSAFEADLGSLERITFEELAVGDRTATSATVTVRTVAEHTDGTDRCSGPLRATKAADGVWRVDPAGISCRRA